MLTHERLFIGPMRRCHAGRLLLAILICSLVVVLYPSVAKAAFAVKTVDGAVDASELGDAYTQAGGHPFRASTVFEVSSATDTTLFPPTNLPEGSVRDVRVELPAGLVGNPTAAAECSEEQLQTTVGFTNACPLGSQVGIAEVVTTIGALQAGLYNMKPRFGTPATFGFTVLGVPTHLYGGLDPARNYAITIKAIDVSQTIPVIATKVTFWGVPASAAHDKFRGSCLSGGGVDPGTGLPCATEAPEQALVSLPPRCTASGEGVPTKMRIRSWQDADAWHAAGFVSHLPPGYPLPPNEWGAPQGPTGCEKVPFYVSAQVQPTVTQADSPSGMEVSLRIPQDGLQSATGLATAHLKKAEVTLQGMSVNPSSVDGLGACSEAQIGLRSDSEATCPESSKIGTVEIETPLLDRTMEGSVYLAQQGTNPFRSLLAIYLVGASKRDGVVIKLPGKVSPDPVSGQLTATFDDNPQLPFSEMRLRFKSGPRAPLITPPRCGTYTTTATFTPWSGTEAVTSRSSFRITSGPNGGACPNGSFNPHLQAGTTNPVAGSHSPFVLRLTRDDGTQELSGITAQLPEGLIGRLAGIPYCPDAPLAGISGAEGTGAAQIASPSCPAASQIGTVTVGAGAGPSPFYVNTGRAYLAGPYRGAPLSMAFVTPAVAGPFDLGNVVVRAALQVNQRTAQITAASDPLPHILHGIPLDLRDVRVNINRPGFTLNPTNCEPTQIATTITSVSGAQAHPASRFQVGDCASLPFRPKLKLQLKGSTTRTGHPALKAVVTYPKEGTYANIARAQVGLPHSEFLDQGNLNKVCKQADLKAGTCPKESIYGWAKAWTPLLAEPLQGPVYLGVGFGYKLPALVADLNGQIRIMLVGRVDTTKRDGIRNTFEVVPDAPVSRFVLRMKGGKKYGLLENSENVCRKKQRASALFIGQNGDRLHMRPRIHNGCGKAKRNKTKRKAHARASGQRHAAHRGQRRE